MRGVWVETGSVSRYLSSEEQAPRLNPSRVTWKIGGRSLAKLHGHFHRICAGLSRTSIPPEHLLRASLLQVFGSDFRWQKRSKGTHASATDRDCRLYKMAPGDAARPSYPGHVLMDNRHSLIAEEQITTAVGTAENDTLAQLTDDRGSTGCITLGADKGYDRSEFVQDLRDWNITPHVSRKYKGSAMDGHTTRDVAYSIGFRVRKGIESIFGWMKTVGECVKRDSVDWNGFVRIVPWCPPSTIWRARNDWVWYDGKHCVQSSGNWGLFELKGKKNTSPGRSTLVFRQIRVQRQFYLRHFLQMCNIEGSQFDSRSHLAQLTRVK